MRPPLNAGENEVWLGSLLGVGCCFNEAPAERGGELADGALTGLAITRLQ